MVKQEVLKEHTQTWRNNGLFRTVVEETTGDGGGTKRIRKRVPTKLFSKFKENVHPSGFASKITVELTKNGDRWDTVTSWKDL